MNARTLIPALFHPMGEGRLFAAPIENPERALPNDRLRNPSGATAVPSLRGRGGQEEGMIKPPLPIH